MKTGRFDIHQHITDKIVSAIERGAGDFRLPWHRSTGSIMRPVNIASKKAYRGINVVALCAYAEEFGYSSGVWGTYRQWAEAGAQVRQGEKAAFVAFYKELAFAADPETDDAETATRLFARATPVFAAEQVDGAMPSTIAAPPITVTTPIEQAEAFVAATGASIQHGGGRAFYRPSTDSIHLPPREAFIGTLTSTPAESYLSTLCHELCHWTSPESRCHRQVGKRFGDQAYAIEELVAELGAAFLCADLQITDEPRADHAQYLASWLAVLKTDKKAIFTAASKASEAAFGGTLDAVGMIGNELILLDWKCANAVYADYLYQLAAYGLLWNENYPDHPPVGGFHLCRFAKEQGDFSHHYFPSLDDEAETFLLMRDLFDRVKKAERRLR